MSNLTTILFLTLIGWVVWTWLDYMTEPTARRVSLGAKIARKIHRKAN